MEYFFAIPLKLSQTNNLQSCTLPEGGGISGVAEVQRQVVGVPQYFLGYPNQVFVCGYSIQWKGGDVVWRFIGVLNKR
jgi:hypothetical protein